MPPPKALRLEGELLRRLARWGATRTPRWFARAAPPVVGLVVCAVAGGFAPARRPEPAPDARSPRRGARGGRRRAHLLDLRLVPHRGPSAARRARASHGRMVRGELQLARRARRRATGSCFATAHTGGWELVGPLLARDHGLRVMIAERPEADPRASAIQDEARRARGVLMAHVGDDPLSALPLVRHLREGGVVALQIDRTPPRQRSRAVTLFGEPRARSPRGRCVSRRSRGRPSCPSSRRARGRAALRRRGEPRRTRRAHGRRRRSRRGGAGAGGLRWSSSSGRAPRSGSTSGRADAGPLHLPGWRNAARRARWQPARA